MSSSTQQASYCIDKLGSLSDNKITSLQYCQICLAFQSHMLNWMKKLAVRLSQPGQLLGVKLVVLSVTAIN